MANRYELMRIGAKEERVGEAWPPWSAVYLGAWLWDAVAKLGDLGFRVIYWHEEWKGERRETVVVLERELED